MADWKKVAASDYMLKYYVSDKGFYVLCNNQGRVTAANGQAVRRGGGG